MRTLFLILVAVTELGCNPGSPIKPAATANGILDEVRVLAIARAAVATNDTWIDRAEFEQPKRQPDGSWSILVWRRPATVGGDRLITIDPEGRVAQYLRGR